VDGNVDTAGEQRLLNPRAPISPKGFERSRSPIVVMGTRATSRSGFARRRASAASSA